MSKLLKPFLISVVGAALVAQPFEPSYALEVPAGTHVILKLASTVSSATQKKGDQVMLTAASDVLVNGRKVIEAGAPATGVVENASKRFILGIGGQLDIRIDKVQAADGSWIPVHFVQGQHSGSNLISVICGVVCCCIFFFIPGKDVSIPAGTMFDVTVVSPTDVH